MLCEFKVRNYKSFSGEQTFSMESGRVRRHNDRVYVDGDSKLVKFNAIYGANGAGKSNLISAMNVARGIILYGLKGLNSDDSFRIDAESHNGESLFEFTICIDEVRYTYGFTLITKSETFTSEYLRYHKYRDVFKTVFSRDISGEVYEYNKKEAGTDNVLSLLFDRVKANSNVLFLNLIMKNKCELLDVNCCENTLDKILAYFETGLCVALTYVPIFYDTLLTDDNMGKITNILKILDMDIPRFAIEDFRNGKDIEHLLSDGTKNVLRLIYHVLHNSSCGTFVIDDFGKSLHPLVTIKIVENMLKEAETRNIQFIVVTNEVAIFDLDLLRQDEITFVNKDVDCSSSIKPFKTINVRFDKKIVNEYLSGGYSGVPVFAN